MINFFGKQRSSLQDWLSGPPQDGTAPEKLYQVQTVATGRACSGKSALLLALELTAVNRHFPSGLYLGGGDPRRVAAMMRRIEELTGDLKKKGLASTLEETEIRYDLFDGDTKRVEFITQECVGQILTNTTLESPPELQRRYQSYCQRLAQAHVIWAIIASPPPEMTAADQARFDADLKITNTYLRKALELHGRNERCSVAIVPTKLDGLFNNQADARRRLTDDILRHSFDPLVQTVLRSDRVASAAIIPTSALGWDRARRLEERPINPEFEEDPERDEEPQWVLKDGAYPVPYNVDTLITWTLLAGLLPQEVECRGQQEPPLASTARALGNDLQHADAWVVRVRSGLA